ncbi:MAG: MFS transporter [Chloroflexi bacterium]|nr:MFS transporter [Chloroflexota bacterium]
MKTSASLSRVVLPVGIGTTLSLIGDVSLYTVLPTHTAVAGVTLASVGILLSANRWVRLLANGAAGWLTDRYAKRTIFVTSLFLGAASTVFYAFSVGFWPLLLGRLLWGIAWAGIWVAGNGIILEAAPIAERGRWVGRYHISFFLGAAMGAILGGYLTDAIGFHQAMMVAASLTFTGAVIALLSVPKELHTAAQIEDTAEHPIIHSSTSLNPNPQSQIPANQPIRWGEMVSATAVLGINRVVIAGIFVPTMALYLLAILGEAVILFGREIGVTTLTGLALGSTTLLSMIVTPIMGNLSDKVNNRWQVVATGLVPGILGFGLLALSIPFAILLGLPLTSVSSSSNQGLSTALMGDLGRADRRGRFLGALYTVGDLGSAIGPLLAFALIPVWGISSLYWLNAILFGLLFTVALYWAQKKKRKMDMIGVVNKP